MTRLCSPAVVVVVFIVLELAMTAGRCSAADPLRQRIDAALAAGWKTEKLTPAPTTTDSEFLRRVYLDIVGTIPTYAEALAFLGDATADKREKLIDRLLADPRYAKHQTDVWDLLLFTRNPPGYDTDKRDGIQRWLTQNFETNRPYDEWVRELLKADGNNVEHGPPTYFMQYRNQPEDATEVITQTFLGVQLQCARCHDHPFESWKQLDFYGMAAFLARLDVVNAGKKDNLTLYAIGEKSSGDILFTGPAKDQQPGKKGDPVGPKFLLGDQLLEPPLPTGFKETKFESNKPPQKPLFSRKDALADWIATTDNKFFSRAIANRIWAQFMGRGIVHPVDNMSPSNVPTHPELLDELSQELVAHKFDLKWLMREITNSQSYQRSSRGVTGEPQPRHFEHARSRPLSAEELLDSWRVATGYDDAENLKATKPNDKGRFRPIEGDYMRRFFGTPNSGAGDFQGGLHEHLFLNNGPLSRLIDCGKGGLAETLSNNDIPLPERIDRLYLTTLSRRPTSTETTRFTEFISQSGSKPRWSDALWVLITSSEFRFSH